MMKINVEGATYQVLVGMGDILDDIKIIHIEAETYAYFQGQKLINDVFTFLQNKSFESVEITYCNIDSNGKQSDFVWINKKYL